MKPNGIITLLTDFGYRDGFVGSMKGVILTINPKAQVVDIAHNLPAGDIESACFVLHGTHHYFPSGTIHTVVVDPGVGSLRRAIAVRADDHFFVAPDNGVLSWIFHDTCDYDIVELTNEDYHLPKVSHTFHGRDVFASVAAHLARGSSFENLGKSIKNVVRNPVVKPYQMQHFIQGEVIYIDRFGNLITNISTALLKQTFPEGQFLIQIQEQLIPGLCTSYADAHRGQPLAIIGSLEFLEIAVRDGNAAEKFQATRTTPVIIKRENV